jgi:serine/threonine protein kinase
MGSVAKVRKRPEAIGGSARSANVIQKDDDSDCINPFVWFQQWMAPLANRVLLSSSPDVPASLLLRSNSDASSRKKEFYYALKSIHLANVTNTPFIEELKNEIEIMKKLDHPHIVRPIEVFQHCRQVFIVMELCSGGDLYTRDPYTEADAARIVSSILSAVSFMHQQNVVHRDLKVRDDDNGCARVLSAYHGNHFLIAVFSRHNITLQYENIMFVNDSPKSEIKLIDFGLSKIHSHDSENLTEGVGTVRELTAPVELESTRVKTHPPHNDIHRFTPWPLKY